MSCETGAGAIGAHIARIVGGQEEFADRGQMQRRTATHRPHHLHAAAFRDRALDIDDLVALADRQIDRLMSEPVELAHRRQRRIAHIESRLHQVAEFQQTDAELITPRLATVDQPRDHQVVQDAVGGRGMKAGAPRQILEADRFRVFSQGVEQRDQPVDNLDRGPRSGIGCRNIVVVSVLDHLAVSCDIPTGCVFVDRDTLYRVVKSMSRQEGAA